MCTVTVVGFLICAHSSTHRKRNPIMSHLVSCQSAQNIQNVHRMVWSISNCIVVFIVNHTLHSPTHSSIRSSSIQTDSHSTRTFNGFGINLIDSTGKFSPLLKNKKRKREREREKPPFRFDENENKHSYCVHLTWNYLVCIQSTFTVKYGKWNALCAARQCHNLKSKSVILTCAQAFARARALVLWNASARPLKITHNFYCWLRPFFTLQHIILSIIPCWQQQWNITTHSNRQEMPSAIARVLIVPV